VSDSRRAAKGLCICLLRQTAEMLRSALDRPVWGSAQRDSLRPASFTCFRYRPLATVTALVTPGFFDGALECMHMNPVRKV
jgi:hypothetical protein